MSKTRKVAWLLALVLGSGAGLLAFGLVALWSGARDAERVAEAELRRSAQATARAVRDALLDPALLARSPRERTLRVDPSGLVIPPEVGWLDAPPSAAVPPVERAALRLEFAGGDRQAARALLARDTECTLAAAWCAQRDGDAPARDALLGHAEPDPSWLLLLARAGRPFPDWAEATVRVLAPDHAEALLARIAESDPARDVAALRSAVRESARWRESLRTARACGAQEAAFVAKLAGDDLVVAHRPLANGTRTGLVLPLRTTLDAFAREARPPWSGTVAIGPARDEAAATALEGAVHVLPEPAPRTAGWLGLSALLGVLALCFALGSVLAFRALRREARAMAARAEFLTSVTHELKTPLAGIRVVAEMLGDGSVTGAQKRAEYVAMLSAESARLSTLIENVLDLGRVERGERGYDRRPHELGALVREAGELFEPVARRDGLALAVRTAGAATASVDRDALVQAVLNLLDNARKYAAEGKCIELRQDGPRIEVRDFGAGIAAHERLAIFAKFARGSAQRDGSVPGLGLGLHLAREIVRAHGGELVHEAPADGPGACFVITLAAAAVSA